MKKQEFPVSYQFQQPKSGNSSPLPVARSPSLSSVPTPPARRGTGSGANMEEVRSNRSLSGSNSNSPLLSTSANKGIPRLAPSPPPASQAPPPPPSSPPLPPSTVSSSSSSFVSSTPSSSSSSAVPIASPNSSNSNNNSMLGSSPSPSYLASSSSAASSQGSTPATSSSSSSPPRIVDKNTASAFPGIKLRTMRVVSGSHDKAGGRSSVEGLFSNNGGVSSPSAAPRNNHPMSASTSALAQLSSNASSLAANTKSNRPASMTSSSSNNLSSLLAPQHFEGESLEMEFSTTDDWSVALVEEDDENNSGSINDEHHPQQAADDRMSTVYSFPPSERNSDAEPFHNHLQHQNASRASSALSPLEVVSGIIAHPLLVHRVHVPHILLQGATGRSDLEKIVTATLALEEMCRVEIPSSSSSSSSPEVAYMVTTEDVTALLRVASSHMNVHIHSQSEPFAFQAGQRIGRSLDCSMKVYCAGHEAGLKARVGKPLPQPPTESKEEIRTMRRNLADFMSVLTELAPTIDALDKKLAESLDK